MEDNILIQLAVDPTRQRVLLDVLFMNRGLAGNVMVGDHLGHSDHKTIEFSVLVEQISWKSQRVHEVWIYFKNEVLNVQELAIPMCLNTNQ